MEQQNTGLKALDSLERAKLGFRVFNLPFDEAEEVIDAYVSQGNYDPASVELFKDQLDTQRNIQEKGAELLSTSAQILRQVVSSVIKNWPKPPEDNPSHSGERTGKSWGVKNLVLTAFKRLRQFVVP